MSLLITGIQQKFCRTCGKKIVNRKRSDAKSCSRMCTDAHYNKRRELKRLMKRNIPKKINEIVQANRRLGLELRALKLKKKQLEEYLSIKGET